MCNQCPTTNSIESYPEHQEMNRAEYSQLALEAIALPGYQVNEMFLTPYPRYSTQTLAVTFAVSLVGLITQPNGKRALTQVIYYRDEAGEETFAWFCFDRFLRRDMDSPDFDERERELLQQVLASKRKEASTSLKAVLTAVAATNVENCGYWAVANKDRSVVHTCDDTKALVAMARVANDGKDLDGVLREYYNSLIATAAAASATKPKAATTVSFRDYAFSQPILFVGESGSGKTRQAYVYAKEEDATLVKLSCEAGTTSIEILGCYMKAPNGDMLWVDGAMTEAFRKASKGEKTVLLIDELLRPDIREISIFLTALDPDPFTGEYVLRTGRILGSDDGVAELETLRVHPSNLCVIATTNMGGKYNVGEMDKALADRFVMFRIDTTAEGVKDATLAACSKHALPVALAEACTVFWTAMKGAKGQHLVTETPTKRILLRALSHASSAAMVPLHLKAMAAHWVSLDADGFPNSSQIVTVNKLIEKSFK